MAWIVFLHFTTLRTPYGASHLHLLVAWYDEIFTNFYYLYTLSIYTLYPSIHLNNNMDTSTTTTMTMTMMMMMMMMMMMISSSYGLDSFPTFYKTTEQTYEMFRNHQEKSSKSSLEMKIDAHQGEDDVVVLGVRYVKSKTSSTSDSGGGGVGVVNDLRFRHHQTSSSSLEPSTTKSSKEPPNKKKIMFLFGEHAREFVSVEAAIRLSAALIGEDEDSELNDLASEVLETYDVTMIPVANPLGREKAENGEFCYRDNANGVDLNRNWDAHWDASLNDGNTNSGSEAFSEPETKILRDVMTETNPHIFMTIHSGTLGMYTPFAYSTSVPTGPEESEMLKMILPLDEESCQCPMGAAGKEVGYLCPGTCLDYAYDVLKVPYAFAFEIYGNEEERKKCKEAFERQKMRFKEAKSTTTEFYSFLEVQTEALHSCFLQNRVETSTEHLSRMSDDECFSFFNPTSKEELEEVTKNWVGVFLKLALKVRDVGRSNGAEVEATFESHSLTKISTSLDSEMGLKIVGEIKNV